MYNAVRTYLFSCGQTRGLLEPVTLIVHDTTIEITMIVLVVLLVHP